MEAVYLHTTMLRIIENISIECPSLFYSNVLGRSTDVLRQEDHLKVFLLRNGRHIENSGFRTSCT